MTLRHISITINLWVRKCWSPGTEESNIVANQENSQSLPEVVEVEVVKYMKYNLGVFYII